MTEQLAGGKHRQHGVDEGKQLGKPDNRTKKQLLHRDQSAQQPMQNLADEEMKTDMAVLKELD
ncbi:hypothetical protein GQ600_7457 [Phytophthora cactorum]|nr:hypothetical protein GQ600_7457 [Phytophthora cactorum]